MILLPSAVEFKEVDQNEFCSAVRQGINAVGHQSTVEIINNLCGTELKMNRIMIRAGIGDIIYIFGLMVRVEEGRILNTEELKQLLQQGKIKFIKATVYAPVLQELAECAGKCDEREYDYIAYKAKGDDIYDE